MDCTFLQFRHYCQAIQHTLNQLPHFSAYYHQLNRPFLKDHDAEYLEIIHTQHHRIIINILYSLPYRIPVLYFMIYDMDSRPLSPENIFNTYLKGQTALHPKNDDTGIFITINPITLQQNYSLHNCQFHMSLPHLVPYYLSLFGMHPCLLE